MAIPFTGMTAAETQILTDIRNHEVVHRDFLKAVLATNAIADPEVNFTSINFADRAGVLGAARTRRGALRRRMCQRRGSTADWRAEGSETSRTRKRPAAPHRGFADLCRTTWLRRRREGRQHRAVLCDAVR
jgi:hypothetical protein